MDPITISILSALAPAVVDTIKAGVSRWITPEQFKPANIAEVVQLQTLELEKFKAVNDSGGAAQWVQNIIKLQRPVIASIALVTWSYCVLTQTPSQDAQTIAQCVFFYLFGERTLLKNTKG